MSADDADIAAFDRICSRLAGFDERLNTEWIDGYLTALAAGPRALAPADWLPALGGEAFARAFADPDDVRQATEALTRRAQAIVRELDAERLFDDPDGLYLRPVLLTPDDDDADRALRERWVGALWADGFRQALVDHADDWRLPADVEADDAAHFAHCLRIVDALTLEDEALDALSAELYPGQQLGRDERIDEACYAVQDLRLFWVDHAPRPATVRVEARPGRNDPCPCGSGKKFKKCCGADA